MSEIPVTPEMIEAGIAANAELMRRSPQCTMADAYAASYRAMRALEPPTCRGEPVETDPEILAYKVLRGGTQVNYVNYRGEGLSTNPEHAVCNCGHPENAAICDRWDCPLLRDPIGR